jgi:hypothetical protein
MNIMEKYSTPTTHVGALTAFFGGLTANEIAAYGGLAIGLAGLCINWYYKAKEDRRRDREVNGR